MYIVSDSFAQAMKNKPYVAKLTLENQGIIQGDAIQEIVFRGGTSGETEAVTLGGVVSGSVEILLNKAMAPVVLQGQQIQVDLGLELENGMEWLPMGVYYVTEPTADDDVMTVKACDALAAKFERTYEALAGFDFESENGVVSTTFLMALCERRGVAVDVSNMEPIALRTAPEGFTERQIVGFIAALYGGFAGVDRAGVLRICTFSKTEQKVTADDYYDGGMVKAEYTYSVQWIKCFNEITELTMIMGDTTAKQGVYLESIWMDNTILANLWEQMQGFTYVPVEELSFFGNPLIDAGDIITMEDMSGISYEVPVMGIAHEYDGGIVTKVTAYGQAEATGQTGSVSRQIQRVAIKAKTYSGIALDEAKKYTDNLDSTLDQLEVLKRLTNETDDALYMTKDGKLAIKATAILTGVLDAAIVAVKNLIADNIVSGILKSKDGETFYLDLDNGILRMQASEFSVSGKTVDEIAEGKASAAVNAQTAEQIFDKWSDGGKIKGIGAKDGVWVVNADIAKIINLIADHVLSESGNSSVDISGAKIKFFNGNNDTLAIENWENSGCIFLYDYNSGVCNSLGTLTGRSIFFQGDGGNPHSQLGLGIGADGLPWMTLPGEDVKDISWEYSEELGKYVLCGK